jgi:hypothetical protein
MIKSKKGRYKYQFQYSFDNLSYKVTVTGNDQRQARIRAKEEVDRRWRKSGRSSPTGWDMTVLQTDDPAWSS